MQNTRLRRRGALAFQQLTGWATNPWRRSSLLLIVLLAGFVSGTSLGALAGAVDAFDPLAALVCVLVFEMAIRLRRPLLRRVGSERLALDLLDMARMGVTYGLLLEGFKASV
ncbi:MAG: DUF565 domain-containing protein [Synechococcus sp. Tobar2m-G35]|nr:DUF565 domain-containing protein [Synechococcus sp. Tobar2m-G35]